jgi:hypothetical protein
MKGERKRGAQVKMSKLRVSIGKICLMTQTRIARVDHHELDSWTRDGLLGHMQPASVHVTMAEKKRECQEWCNNLLLHVRHHFIVFGTFLPCTSQIHVRMVLLLL